MRCISVISKLIYRIIKVVCSPFSTIRVKKLINMMANVLSGCVEPTLVFFAGWSVLSLCLLKAWNTWPACLWPCSLPVISCPHDSALLLWLPADLKQILFVVLNKLPFKPSRHSFVKHLIPVCFLLWDVLLMEQDRQPADAFPHNMWGGTHRYQWHWCSLTELLVLLKCTWCTFVK